VLNIAWVDEALYSPASIICPRSTACPRPDPGERRPAGHRASNVRQIKQDIIARDRASQGDTDSRA
jgi:hypothetical protein